VDFCGNQVFNIGHKFAAMMKFVDEFAMDEAVAAHKLLENFLQMSKIVLRNEVGPTSPWEPPLSYQHPFSSPPFPDSAASRFL